MTTSRIPVTVEALVALVGTAVGSAVKVYDGKWVTVPDGDYITVGWTPDQEGSTGQQTWDSLGNRARDEVMDIPCYIDSYSGSTDTAARRNAAFGLLALIEPALRGDPTLGGVLPQPGWAEVGQYNERIEETEAGLAVGVVFHINARARL